MSLKYEGVYLKAFTTLRGAEFEIGNDMMFYHGDFYVVIVRIDLNLTVVSQ